MVNASERICNEPAITTAYLTFRAGSAPSQPVPAKRTHALEIRTSLRRLVYAAATVTGDLDGGRRACSIRYAAATRSVIAACEDIRPPTAEMRK